MNEIKNILCYGDSNTFGLKPDWAHQESGRYDENTRWPRLLEKLLGKDYRVTEAGLNGRTTVFKNPEIPGRSGIEHLRVCVESHLPLSLVIISLGTNDTFDQYNAGPEDIAAGMDKILDAMDNPGWYFMFPKPKILVLCPAPIRETALLQPGGRTTPAMLEKSRQLAPLYAEVAAKHGCAFFDIASVTRTSDEDGVHLSAAAHRALAEALSVKVAEILK